MMGGRSRGREKRWMKLMKGKLPFPDDGNCRLFRGRQKKTIFFQHASDQAFIICLFFIFRDIIYTAVVGLLG